MEITVIDDRVELNGFTLARLASGAPATMSAWFVDMINGADEAELLSESFDEGRAAGYDDGYADGTRSRDDEIDKLEDELSDLTDAARKVCEVLKGVKVRKQARQAIDDLAEMV